MASLTKITPSELFDQIGVPDTPVIIDVCIDEDFSADPRLIPTAKRYPFNRIEELVSSLNRQETAIVCQKGLKLSMGAAAILQTHGIAARYLEGGNFAWRDADLPLIPADLLPKRDDTSRTRWVTGGNLGFERIACCWLIRRFIDPMAKILFVDPTQVVNVAEKFDATSFDVKDAFWSHKGDMCTFDMMVKKLCLDTGPLGNLANIVRRSVSGHLEPAPETAGLRTITAGLAKMHKSDQTRMETGMLMFDALFQQLRSESINVKGQRTEQVGHE